MTFKRATKLILSFCLLANVFTITNTKAADNKINITAAQVKAKGASAHPVQNIVDGDHSTYWKSMSFNGEGDSNAAKIESRMIDHNRYIDITLDATYNLSAIKMFNVADGSYSNYYIYASVDGVNYQKIVSKTDTKAADGSGDLHNVNAQAAYLRINMAYNSNSFETNLADIEIYGTKYLNQVTQKAPITVTPWEDSKWKEEWDRFENDEAYANEKVLQEAKNLVGRIIGKQWQSFFTFELRPALNGMDVYEIEDGTNGDIIIRGNNGIALASGFNYYLKNYAMIDYNPLFASNTNMKKVVPVGETIIKTTQYDYRYALNFCTYSYTMSFWNWEEYEAFIDWAAMNGVNLMLDIVGQEEVIRELLLQYNYTDEEIKDYIAGPAYFAWFYMQNLYSFGGPLPDSWFAQRVELGRKMHDRMQTYGIDPVIQGFAGQVPLTFDDKNSGSVLTPIDEWPTFTRPAIVSPYLTQSDINAGKVNYFPEMAKKFYEAQRNVFGDVSHYYATDPFHEGGKTAGLDIKEIYAQVQTEMLNADDQAVWVMQQWQGNLDDKKLSGLVKPEHALALDLQSDLNQQHGVMENHQVPWIWNMLHNFGGRMGLDGELEVTATQMPLDFNNKQYMKGIGITPEALENSPVAYELMFDMTWSKDPIDVHAWLETYAKRRAGGTSDSLLEAWNILNETAYAKKGQYFQGAAETVINAKPTFNFTAASTWGHSSILYDKTELDQALKLLIDNYDAFAKSEAFRYDLADVAEQVLCNSAIEYHSLMREAYNSGDGGAFRTYAQKFLEIIALSDEILGSNQEFMLGTWINDSRTMLDNMDDWTKDLFEFNARALVTTWGGERSNSLNDYSNRKWAGLTKSYYYERWKMWIGNRQAELDGTAKNPEYVKAESNWFMWGWRWANLKSDDGFGYTTTADASKLKENAQKALDEYSVTKLQESGGVVEAKVNIALGKQFTSNSATKAGTLANITDGSTGSSWEGEGAGPHELTLDLEGLYELSDMNIAIRQAAGDYPMDYKVEYMDENGAWQIYEPQHTNEAMQSNTSIAKTVKATQIRVTMSTRDYNNFSVYLAEIEVFGKALETITYQNLALGKPATASRDTAVDGDLKGITDGDLNSLWKANWTESAEGMYPCEIIVDLGGYANADYVEVYFEKIGLPYQYKIEIEDSRGNKTTIIDEDSTTEPLSSRSVKIPVGKKEVAKVYFTFTKRLETSSCATACGAASPGIAELRVLSTESLTVTKNYALKKPVSVSSIYDKPASNLNDGDYSTSWNYNGDVDHDSGFAEVNLETSQYINDIRLTFNKETYTKYYIFDVVTIKSDGTENIVFSETGANQTNYIIPVNDTIQRVRVNYKGKSQTSNGWFDIVELEAIGPVDEHNTIIFNDGSQINTTSDSKYQATLDNNNDTFVNNIQDQEIVYQLDGRYYVDHVNFTFEKAGLGLKYVVYAENEQGERTLVTNRSNTTALLEDRTIRIDVNQIATKLIFKHLGNNGKGDAYLAETRLYETRIYGGTPENVALQATTDPANAQAIIDDKTDTTYTLAAGQSVTISLNEAADLNLAALYNEMAAPNYRIEVFDVNANDWINVYDVQNQNKPVSEKFFSFNESIFADKVRITAQNTLKIQEFKLYKSDKRGELNDKITEIEAIINSKQYNDTNGSYTHEAKAKIDAKIQEAKDAVNNALSSKDVAQWIQVLNEELKCFYRDGLVYVDRSQLLKEINHTDIVKKGIAELGNPAFENLFDNAYNDALNKYNQYLITQTDIDQAAATLKQETETILAKFDILDQYRIQLAVAKKLSEDVVIGDTDNTYPQEAFDTFQSAVADVESAFASITSPDDVSDLIQDLKDAIDALEATKIVVDRSLLQALLTQYADLNKADYDFATWQPYATLITEGQELYDAAAVSEAQITDICDRINDAYDQLETLNRSVVRQALDEYATLQEAKYTASSWATVKKAHDKANTLYQSDEVTQDALNDAADALYEAIANLEEKGNDETPVQRILHDENGSGTYAQGNFAENMKFYVNAQNEEQIRDILKPVSESDYFQNHTVLNLYQMYFTKDGSTYFEDSVTVHMPMQAQWKEKALRIIHIDENGNIREVQGVVQGDKYTFLMETNGYYAVVAEFVPQEKDEYVDQIVNDDENVTVFGKFPVDVNLIVKEISDTEKATVLDTLQNPEKFAKYTFEKVYDIYMLRNQLVYKPNGVMTIRIKLSNDLLNKSYLGIAYIADDGKVTVIPSNVKDGYISFTTNHNSYYAIISSDSPIGNTATQAETSSTNVNMLGFLLLGAVCILITRKRQKQ